MGQARFYDLNGEYRVILHTILYQNQQKNLRLYSDQPVAALTPGWEDAEIHCSRRPLHFKKSQTLEILVTWLKVVSQ